jgi:hypothetical protein
MRIEAVRCDKCGAKEASAEIVPKGWRHLVLTDRVVSNLELDLCERHGEMTINQLETLAREVRETKSVYE